MSYEALLSPGAAATGTEGSSRAECRLLRARPVRRRARRAARSAALSRARAARCGCGGGDSLVDPVLLAAEWLTDGVLLSAAVM